MKKPINEISVTMLRSIIKTNGITIKFVADQINTNPSNLARYFFKDKMPIKLRSKVEQFINDKNLY
jgi:hypothetical protein